MNEEKIYFTLIKKIPETLYAQYKDRKAKVGIAIVPAVVEAYLKGEVLLYEEEIALAVDYLKTVLYFPINKLKEIKKWIR